MMLTSRAAASAGIRTTISIHKNISTTRIIQQQHHHHHQQQQRCSVSTLILLRHGQSIWNVGDKARFTGWCDVPLTVRGRVEAVAAGQLMRSRGFQASRVCIAFASELQRSHETCELALASMAGHAQHTWSSERIRRDWRLNERHYGNVQGKLKDCPELKELHGEETIRFWRRSMHGKPPPMKEDHEYYLPPPAPLTESLADCQRRVLDCWEDSIAPALFDEIGLHKFPPDDRTIIVVAHANTIRSLMAHFDDVPEEDVVNLYVPNSVPILYRFDREKSRRHPISLKLKSRHGDSHARWMISSENHHAVRDAIKQGGTLTRALFDAITTQDFTQPTKLTITGAELQIGIRDLMRDSAVTDCVVLAMAKEILHSMGPSDEIHLEEFERRAQEAYDGLTFRHLNDQDTVAGEGLEWY